MKVFFRMSKDSDVETVNFQEDSTPTEVDNYFEEKCGGVCDWWFAAESDSRHETIKHIKRVAELMYKFSSELMNRANVHDKSKLEPPEKEIFDKYSGILKDYEYGSEEYYMILRKLQPALEHHYKVNRHHPEHHQNGLWDMNLFDIVEMFLDWKAASERHTKGNFDESIAKSAERFGVSPQLQSIFENTAEALKNS